MTGDLVLIVLEIKLIVIGQLERKEDRIKVGKGEGPRCYLRAGALESNS